MKKLRLYNSYTAKKEDFNPLDPNNIRMYVCGPTVYDRPHLGNARAVVVYDVLYRLLKHLYPKVTYVRNITDVDDKINAAAKANNEPISALTKRVTGWFHDDMKALNCLNPDVEPTATAHVGEMIELIEKIIENGRGYVSQGHVLFDVYSIGKNPPSIPPPPAGEESGGRYYFYGKLSGKKLDDLIAGARVEVESYKKNPGDFVLWKPAEEGDDPSSIFDSPWGKGRPGWHIECSAMSAKHLGVDFDIHGGGADLKFPHHENEIAQSLCGNKGSHFATYWIHNGFLTVNGEKMSKSLGNFITVRELLDKGIKGEVIRFVLLTTKYNEPLDWTEDRIKAAKNTLDTLYRNIDEAYNKKNAASNIAPPSDDAQYHDKKGIIKLYSESIEEALCDDLNTLEALVYVNKLVSLGRTISIVQDKQKYKEEFQLWEFSVNKVKEWLGLLELSSDEWFGRSNNNDNIEALIEARSSAKKARNWAEADKIREELKNQGIILEDKPDGTTIWRRI